MSEQKYSVGYKLEDKQGNVIDEGNLSAPGSKELPVLLEPKSRYVLTYDPPEPLRIIPNTVPFRTGDKHTRLTVTLSKDGNALTHKVQDGSGDRIKQTPNLVSRVALGVLGVGGAATVAFSPTVLPSASNALKLPVIPSSRPAVPAIQPRSPSVSGTTITRTASSESELGAKLRECLKANFENLSGISQLSDLAKQGALARVTNEELAKEMMQWYGKIDRLRQILQGCDPELASQLKTLVSGETNSAQPRSADRISDQFSSILRPVNISTCNGQKADANFRSDPTKARSAILGGIAYGSQVYLTGRTYEAGGVVWYEAIAPTAKPDAGKQIKPNQAGWIANCFVQ